MRKFNTSGPNMPAEHYTLPRLDWIEKGKELVHLKRYFTIWALRQTGQLFAPSVKVKISEITANCLLIFYFNLYLYGTSNLEWLPIMQKVTFISTVILILCLEYFTKKEDFDHITR